MRLGLAVVAGSRKGNVPALDADRGRGRAVVEDLVAPDRARLGAARLFALAPDLDFPALSGDRHFRLSCISSDVSFDDPRSDFPPGRIPTTRWATK